jgi:hypothetical protein
MNDPDQVLEATEGFVCELDGQRFFVQPGTTRIAASHPLAKAHPTRFRPIQNDLTYADDATSTELPGSTEGRSRTRQKAQTPARSVPATATKE